MCSSWLDLVDIGPGGLLDFLGFAHISYCVWDIIVFWVPSVRKVGYKYTTKENKLGLIHFL